MKKSDVLLVLTILLTFIACEKHTTEPIEHWNLVLTQWDAINVLTDDSGRIQIKSYSLADNTDVEFYLLVKDQDDKPLADPTIFWENK